MMIKKNILLSILLTLLITTILMADTEIDRLNLMPIPENVLLGDGEFRLDVTFTVNVSGDGSAERLVNGVIRALTRLSGRTGLFLIHPAPLKKTEADTFHMIINASRIGALTLSEDESYKLKISPTQIELTAVTDIGALRGLETLLQLIDANEQGYFFPVIQIDDQPRFPWRGLLIDACRHFMPVEVVKRNLDAMAAVKMNVLHWHLTEDQGFRIECKSFPKLHQLGSDGLYYTHEQIRDIVNYASELGIRVVPEFDLPGHATSWLVGYPELASVPGPYTIQRNWGIFDPTFDPTRNEVYKFLETFFKEMATLFPDPYWHIGGDENNGHQWDANPKIQEFMKKNNLPDNHALQNYFNQKLEKILNRLDKTMVGWYTDAQPVLDKKYIIQSWKGRKSLYESARNGHRCLLSHGFYIDLIQPTAYHYLNDPLPPDSVLTEVEKKRILGGEATMWAEFVGPETIDSRIWPRTAAVAERLWSPGYVNDIDGMFRRLTVVSFRLEELGLTHEKNYDMMLRRLANNADWEALKNFVDVIEPMYTYSRDHPHVFKSYYPLTRVVDAARPDPPIPREFDRLVDRVIAEKTDRMDNLNAIADWLNMWKMNHARLEKVILGSPVLREIETLSKDLAACATIGLEAIDYINKHEKPASDWIDAQLVTLKNAQKPRGETELLIVPSIEKLVNVTFQ